jgi:hypothetical protein
MDDKSTPIESLNNKGDESEVVNQILSKYNNLQDGPQDSIPPMNKNITQMENQFENRNLNQELYDLGSKNVGYDDHYSKEMKRANSFNNPNQGDLEEPYEDENYEEYEIEEVPLWRRVLNEIRIVLYIFIFVIVFFNCSFDKFFVGKLPYFGNQFNECNTYGVLLKALFVSLLSYIFIRFIRI